MIHLRVRPEYSEEDYTDCYFDGSDEEAVANVIAARLRGADWDVLVAESDRDEQEY